MEDKISPAIEALEQQLQRQLEDVAETKKTINALCKALGKEPMYADVAPERVTAGPLRRDQYYGRPLSTVAQEFLERRKEACTPHEITNGLRAGGFDFKSLGWGQEKDWPRNLAITLAKNSKAFHRLPNGTFGLGGWYPEARRDREERPTSKQGRPAEDTDNDMNGSTDEKK